MEQLTQFATNHWQLWLALIIMLVMIFINELISQKKTRQRTVHNRRCCNDES